MAIAEDSSSPASVTVTNSGTATYTTASFRPPHNSLLIAMSGNDWQRYAHALMAGGG
jgi:pyruvate kinase